MFEKIKEFFKRLLGIDMNTSYVLLDGNTKIIDITGQKPNIRTEDATRFVRGLDARDFVKANQSIEDLMENLGLSSDEINLIIDSIGYNSQEKGNQDRDFSYEETGGNTSDNFYHRTANGTTIKIDNMTGGIVSTDSNAVNTINVPPKNSRDKRPEDIDNPRAKAEKKLKDSLENLDPDKIDEIRGRVNTGIISFGNNTRNTVIGNGEIESYGENTRNTVISR